MGFTDPEIVALLGAHAVGRCHTDRSGTFSSISCSVFETIKLLCNVVGVLT